MNSAAQHPFLTMAGPPGSEALEPISLWAEEELNRPFLFTVQLISARADVAADSLLNQPICITMGMGNAPSRYFHGIVKDVVLPATWMGDSWSYSVQLVPRLWFMSLTRDCRVFQHQTVEQIIGSLLADMSIEGSQFRFTDPKPTREYTVQWNETDLDFLTRLVEEEGCFYFFEHTRESHTLVFGDSNTAFKPLAQPDVRVAPHAPMFGNLSSWRVQDSVSSGVMVLKDLDPTSPAKHLESTQKTILETPGAGSRDVFDWPALSFDLAEVDRRTRFRMQAAEVGARVAEGAGFHQGFVPGRTFTLELDPESHQQNEKYVLQSVYHQASSEGGASGVGGFSYNNGFVAFSSRSPWRHPPNVLRPRMHGIYSAVVIGAEGEEIYTDEYMRVKVRFPWDRRNDSTPGSSVWLRVIQPWAGRGWGWQYIPRVGTEVAVAFMDGDIDRPVVVGAMYNADYMPPFPLPDQKTKTGLRTRSTIKGGASNYSEFSIDDKKGQELVFLHAEKNHTIEVENDDKLTIGNCRTKTVQADETVTIGGNQTIGIQRGNRSVTISQGDDSLLLEMGNLSTRLSMGNMTIELSLGDMSTKADAGKIEEEAMQSITMKVGASSITIDQTGVTISGLMVAIKGQVQTEVQGVMTKVSGAAMTQISGGIIMIG